MNWLGLAAGLVIGAGAERVATRGLRSSTDRPSRLEPAPGIRHHIDTPDGGVLHVTEYGSGPPLVLLHGVTLRADIWHHQHVLADEARVIAVDLLGHGDSSPGRHGPTVGAGARAIVALLEYLDLTDVVIAGHSMGGMVLGRFIVDHPEILDERVIGVGLISTAGRNPGGKPTKLLKPVAGQLHRIAVRYPKLARRLADIPPNDLGQILVRSTFGSEPDLVDIRETVEAFEAISIENFLAIAPSLLDHDVLDRLSSCRLPAAIIVGSRDPMTPPKESRLLADALPNSTLEIVPDAGHQLMLERPDEVNAMLRELLARAALQRRPKPGNGRRRRVPK